jgi:molybdopterin/thiamine biosynthesis adenylyltransferase
MPNPIPDRYRKQVIIDGFGPEGQEKLSQARVLIAGAGGLGSVISLYLAAAGVGKIGLIDNDKVEVTNLNRQILYDTESVGKPKVDEAGKRLRKLNPDIKIETIYETITEDNVASLAGGYDLIADAMDNFEARFILNRLAIKRNMPFFHGAVQGFEGRVSTIIPRETPCFACIYPFTPPKKEIPVLGTTPAVIGSLQATEVIKYITGIGTLLKGKLLVYEGMSMEFMTVNIRRKESCPACGKS